MKINRNQLRKMILQELILIGAPKAPSKFSLEDQDFAHSLQRFASRDYPESQIEIDLSDRGVGISSSSGAFPPVTLRTFGPEYDHQHIDGYNSSMATIYVSGPGGLSGQFQGIPASRTQQRPVYAYEVAAKEILARLHHNSETI